MGRYELQRRLGSGGMGVVYAARDADLDRTVALKFVHRGVHSAALEDRVLSEARLLGQLSHPNVIEIYDVGRHEGQVYLAMRYVEGGTLRQWLEAETRSPEQILAQFVSAGRGLAAAHAHGIVHRDFKPDNVMIDADDRVVVLDFGLATNLDEDEPATGSIGRAISDGAARTGAMIGTPRYMAPEQFESKPADARTDQFSFCVALWEALHRKHPFLAEGDHVATAAVANTSGRFVETGVATGIPLRIDRALRRGLSQSPDARFPDMSSLLRALTSGVGRSTVVVTTVALVAGVSVAVWASSADEPDSCANSGLREAWTAETRARIAAAFEAASADRGAGAAERVTKVLDDFAGEWIRQHAEVCSAPASEIRARRLRCLDTRRRHFAASVQVLADADSDTVLNAVGLVDGIPSLDVCREQQARGERAAVPPAGKADAVAAVDFQVALARAMLEAGEFTEAHELVAGACDEARELAYDPLIADCLKILGSAQSKVGQTQAALESLETAYHLGIACHNDEAAIDSATDLLITLGNEDTDLDEVLTWGRRAQAIIDRLGSRQSAHQVSLLVGQALAYYRDGQLAQAESLMRESLEIADAIGYSDYAREPLHGNLAIVLYAQKRYDESASEGRLRLETQEKSLGPQHPKVASTLTQLGAVDYRRGDKEAARAALERALEITELSHGADHPVVADRLSNLALIVRDLGERQLALQYYLRAQAILERTEDPTGRRSLNLHANLGALYNSMERYEQAVAEYAKSLEHTRLPAERSDRLQHMGVALIGGGRVDEGIEHLREGLALAESEFPPEHPAVSNALYLMGSQLVNVGRPVEAVDLLARAVELTERHQPEDVARLDNARRRLEEARSSL